MFYEYPKARYRNGEYMAVASAEEEAAAAAEGWTDWYADQARLAAPKEEVAEDVDDIEALREEAASLGVKVDRRWKEDRLRSEIEKAK